MIDLHTHKIIGPAFVRRQLEGDSKKLFLENLKDYLDKQESGSIVLKEEELLGPPMYDDIFECHIHIGWCGPTTPPIFNENKTKHYHMTSFG